jgi:hypothetical protein
MSIFKSEPIVVDEDVELARTSSSLSPGVSVEASVGSDSEFSSSGVPGISSDPITQPEERRMMERAGIAQGDFFLEWGILGLKDFPVSLAVLDSALIC